MATNVLTKNNARSTLLSGITSGATNLSVQAGHGARFSAPVTGELVKLTLYDTAGNIEICHGITRSGDGWSTIIRAQEGTAARAWNAGDGISENATAAFLTGLSQLDRTETYTAKKTFSAGAALNGVTEFGNGIGPGYLNNVNFASTVAANALTCALKGADGNDPSATNPVEASFRSTTLTASALVVRKLVAAMSVVLPQGGTGGFVINTIGTFTVTIASPAVVTLANHGLVDGQHFRMTTTGALPTGLASGATDNYVKYINANTFNVAATLGGANINTSGTQSGVHTLVSGEVGYLYKYLVDNGSTQQIGFIKKAILDESVLHNTTAIGTGSGSDNVLYTTTAVTNAAVRLIGRSLIQVGMDAVNAAGNWPNAPTRREVWAPSMSKTGEVVQVVNYQTGAVQTNTALAAIPDDDSIPQSNEGDQFMSVSITPRRAENYLRIDVIASLASNVSAYVTSALFQDSIAGALAATQLTTTGIHSQTAVITHYMRAGTASPTTFKYRAGPDSSSTNLTFNGRAGARKLGGVIVSSMTVTEISG